MTLEDYERSVSDLVRGRRSPSGAGEEEVIRWAVLAWARHGLTQVCPLTMAVLVTRERADAEVALQVALGERPIGLHAWGRALTERLARDTDPQVALAASVEHATLLGISG